MKWRLSARTAPKPHFHVGAKEKMDTDYLTPMTRECIRLAEDAVHTLSSELGAACSQYRYEDAYLQGILSDVKEIEEDPEDYLDLWNMIEEVDMQPFLQKLRVLREHIEKTIKTPIAERGEPEFKL